MIKGFLKFSKINDLWEALDRENQKLVYNDLLDLVQYNKKGSKKYVGIVVVKPRMIFWERYQYVGAMVEPIYNKVEEALELHSTFDWVCNKIDFDTELFNYDCEYID